MTVVDTRLALKNCVIVDTALGIFLAPSGDLVTKHLIDFGAHTGPFVELALSVVEAGDTVVDVGGHIGTYTVPLARRVGPSGRVIVFEPNPATRELLEINIELNDLGRVVTVCDAAVGSEPGRASLQSRRANTGAAQLGEPDGDPGDIPVETLDGRITSSPSLIKIDVEGFELHVLLGAETLLERSNPALLLEVDSAQLERYGHSTTELEAFLRAREYRFLTHDGERNTAAPGFRLVELDQFSSRDGLFDVLAVHDEVADRLMAAAAGRTGDESGIVG